MSVDATQIQSHQNFATFLETHKGIAIGGGVILLLVIAGIMMRSKQKTLPVTATGGAPDLSGLTGGKVYVPSQTTFSTQNIKYGPLSNDPNLTSATLRDAFNTTSTSNVPPSSIGGQPDPRPLPPVPAPPPTAGKGLIWDTRRTVLGGETLSSIAAGQTRYLRSKGMPGSMMITWHDLYAHNTDVIARAAQAHGYTSDVWNWIFPGEILTVPRWG